MRSSLPLFIATSLAISTFSSVFSQSNVPTEGDDAQLWTCVSNSPRQTWLIEDNDGSLGNHIVLANSFNSSINYWLVLDIGAWSNSTGAEIHVWYNSTGNQGYNEQWHYNSTTGQIISLMNGMCATAASSLAGMPVRTQPCAPNTPTQQFDYQPSTMQFLYRTNPSLCLDAGSAASCAQPPFNTYTYCNPDASLDDRLADLIPRLSPADYQSLLDNSNPGIPRLGIPKIQFGECLHGPLSGCGAPYTDPTTGYTSTGCPTSFPHSLLQGATFNRSLWTMIGTVISTEDRALHNQNGIAASIFWAPDINPFRDPRWGRGMEVAGEDPFLLSEWVNRYSNALQIGEDPRYIKAASTAKHFSGYDLESSDGTWRGAFDALITDGDLVNYYWVPFQAAVERAHVQGIMCSYNAVNGIPSCANDFFNNEIVRNQWNYNGHYVSDCGAIAFIQDDHHYTNDRNSTVEVALHGGTDVNCGDIYDNFIVSSFTNGNITLNDLQIAGTRLLRTVFQLGLVDPPERVVYTSYNNTMVDTPQHRQLALETAQQGIILLQNNNTNTPWGSNQPLLPLRSSSLKRVAVVGPNANATLTLLSNYHGDNQVVMNQSILASLQRRGTTDGFSVDFQVGCWLISCPDSTGFNAAVNASNNADVTIVVVGLCSDNCPDENLDNVVHEGEGHDRLYTDLPGLQEQLIKAIVATGKPVVVVTVHGGILSMDWTVGNVPTILDALYPGEMGGDAVTSILFGDVAPSGRTTTTWYPTAYQTQRPNVTDMVLPPHTASNGQAIPGITHLYYTGPVLYPFGWGLSYTTFSYVWFNPDTLVRSIDAVTFGTSKTNGTPNPYNSPVYYAVNVTNTGSVTSDVSVLAFVSSDATGQPVQELFDFQRTSQLAPGQTVTLFFSLPPGIAATVSVEGEQRIVPGTTYRIRIGEPERTGNYIETTLTITGNETYEMFNLKTLRAQAMQRNVRGAEAKYLPEGLVY